LGELMGMILYEPIPSLIANNPALPGALEPWWRRASARDPDQRFQSAKELADTLAEALGIEAKWPIPKIAPLGLQTRTPRASALKLTTPIASVALVRGDAAISRSGHGLDNAYSSVQPRRPHFKHEHWLLPAGTLAVFAVMAIAALSSGRYSDAARAIPALLRISPAVSAPAPAPPVTATGSRVHARAATAAPEVVPVVAPPTGAAPAPARARAPRVPARAPVSARSRPEKPLQLEKLSPGLRQTPRRPSEHDAGKQSAPEKNDTGPDYGI
jgi:eukaryotic-like serine/threonine-protein kinase